MDTPNDKKELNEKRGLVVGLSKPPYQRGSGKN